jgi:DNA topoisomerase-2
MKIVGLQMGLDYMDASNFSGLRYGCVMIMTDQDHDGSHIKGLLLNFFEHFWPSLLQQKGFLKEFVTPIIKIGKKAGPKSE